jgi:hypothetical protein
MRRWWFFDFLMDFTWVTSDFYTTKEASFREKSDNVKFNGKGTKANLICTFEQNVIGFPKFFSFFSKTKRAMSDFSTSKEVS